MTGVKPRCLAVRLVLLLLTLFCDPRRSIYICYDCDTNMKKTDCTKYIRV